MLFVDDPTVALFIISLVAFAYAALSNYLLRTLGNRKRLKHIQAEINRLNKIAAEAAREGKEVPHKPGETEHSQLFGLVQESLVLQFKPLVVTLLFFFVITAALRAAFPVFQVVLAFSIPVFIQNLDKFPNWRDTFGVFGWFLLAAVFGGLVIQFISDKFLPDSSPPAHPAHPHHKAGSE